MTGVSNALPECIFTNTSSISQFLYGGINRYNYGIRSEKYPCMIISSNMNVGWISLKGLCHEDDYIIVIGQFCTLNSILTLATFNLPYFLK